MPQGHDEPAMGLTRWAFSRSRPTFPTMYPGPMVPVRLLAIGLLDTPAFVFLIYKTHD